MHEGEKGVVEAIWLLFSSCICVPLVVKMLPGGSPVLGYLLGGAIVGPHALGLVHDVQVCVCVCVRARVCVCVCDCGRGH